MALVMNLERVSALTLRGQVRHDARTDKPKNCDPTRTHLNRVLAGTGHAVRDTAAVVRGHNAAARKDNERPYHRYVLSGSNEELDTPAKQAAFEAKAMAWLRKHYGDGLAYAVAHLDEQTYHIHAVCVPLYQQTLTRNGTASTAWKISHKQHPATKGKNSYKRLRRDCAKSLGLDYGVEGGKPKDRALADTLRDCHTIEAHAREVCDKRIQQAQQQAARMLREAADARQRARERELAIEGEMSLVLAVGKVLEARARTLGEVELAKQIVSDVAGVKRMRNEEPRQTTIANASPPPERHKQNKRSEIRGG
jgi:hypothetical protein